jgi:hypothetical protein
MRRAISSNGSISAASRKQPACTRLGNYLVDFTSETNREKSEHEIIAWYQPMSDDCVMTTAF